MQVTSLALESVEEKLERIFFARRRRGSFITTPRGGTRSRKESNRERSSAHTYQSLRRGISQRVSLIACAFACASKRRIKAVGVDPGSILLAAPCHADAGIAECSSSSKTFAARLLREPSSVDYQAKRGVERGDQIKHISSLATHSQSDGSSFSIHFLFKLQAAVTFRSTNLSSKVPYHPTTPHRHWLVPANTNMNAPTTIRIGFATNRTMALLSICLAVGVGIFGTVEASDIVDNNFAFGRPISVGSGARRKRLPGSQLKGGSGLLTIEELEKEFEAVR